MLKMPELKWDQAGERLYETGVSNGVLFVRDGGEYGEGVAWNGLSEVQVNPDGGEPNDIFADNIKYLTLYSNEEFQATIGAYTYPEEFERCEGMVEVVTGASVGQQPRRPFGFSWRTIVGNDEEFNDFGYKIHVAWGLQASPAERANETINDTPEPINFSWDVTSTPVAVQGYQAISYMVFDSTKLDEAVMDRVKAKLWGSEDGVSELPHPQELIDLLQETP